MRKSVALMLFVLSVGSILSACSDEAINDIRKINFNRDVCIRESSDRIGSLEIGKIYLNPNASNPNNHPNLIYETGKLIDGHNLTATKSGEEFDLLISPPRELNSPWYEAVGSGILCRKSDHKICRNRGYWLFSPVDSSLIIRIIFSNLIANDPKIISCTGQ